MQYEERGISSVKRRKYGNAGSTFLNISEQRPQDGSYYFHKNGIKVYIYLFPHKVCVIKAIIILVISNYAPKIILNFV